MSTENIYEYLQGEFQSITRWEQESAGGSGLVFIRDQNGVKMLCANIELWDAATGGTQLTLDTDYTLEYFDANISGAEGVECYAGYAVINPVYQGITLYVTGDAYGGYTSRPYRPTYTEVSSDVTVATSNMDDSIIADASSGAISVTLPDGHTKNQRFSIICTGGDTVRIIGTGITDAEFTDIGITYVWDGSAWVQLGGAGGSALINIPQPKTFVEKWNDGGSGTVTSKVNEWGAGIYIIDVASTVFSKDNQTLFINVESLTEDTYAPYIGSAVTVGNFKYDHASNSFTYADSIVYIKRISLWEDDPDNLPIQTIPADPSLIKDWVERYDGADAGILTSITNSWGVGKYKFVLRQNDNTDNLSIEMNLKSLDRDTWGSLSSLGTGASSSSATVTYDTSAGAFVINKGLGETFYFEAIYRWEDVAGADAQMSVPVDGWETVFDDDTNTGDVTNSWGAGYYRVRLERSDNLRYYTCLMYLDIENMIAGEVTRSANHADGTTASHYLMANYEYDSNAFTVRENVTGAFYITRIDKFNSLVNVLHSYVPDPRQVAQKDWVEVYNSPINSASNTTFKVTDGKYIVSSGPANDTITYETSISIDNTKTLCRCVHDASFNLEYTPSTGVWNTNISNVGIHFISKWQDSQASDSPRTALDDGFETVYEDASNTSTTITQAVENGTYEVTIEGSGVVYTPIVGVNNVKTSATGSWTASGQVTYTVSSGLWNTGLASHYITKIRKFTGKTVIDAQYVSNIVEGNGITFASINTDAGDVDVSSYFTDTSLGRTVKLRNTGTNGNHLTGCPDSISIGDGKTFEAWYSSGWNYQDTVIDEYSEVDGTASAVTHHVRKWADGAMEVVSNKAAGTTGNQTVVFPEAFTSREAPMSSWGATCAYVVSYSNTGMVFASSATGGGSAPGEVAATTPGRWKS